MKNLIIVLFSFTLIACGPSAEEKAYMEKEKLIHSGDLKGSDGSSYTLVEIDGCQYICGHDSGGNTLFTHKGNCDNPEHAKQQ